MLPVPYEKRVGDLTIDGYVLLLRAGRLPEQEFPASRTAANETAMTLRWASRYSGSDVLRHVIEDLANTLHPHVLTGPEPGDPYIVGPAIELGSHAYLQSISFEELSKRLEKRLGPRSLSVLPDHS